MHYLARLIVVIVALILIYIPCKAVYKNGHAWLYDRKYNRTEFSYRLGDSWTLHLKTSQDNLVHAIVTSDEEFCFMPSNMRLSDWENTDPCASKSPLPSERYPHEEYWKWEGDLVSGSYRTTDKEGDSIMLDVDVVFTASDKFKVYLDPDGIDVFGVWVGMLILWAIVTGVIGFISSVLYLWAEAIPKRLPLSHFSNPFKYREKRKRSIDEMINHN
jgi:hypothetical protein